MKGFDDHIDNYGNPGLEEEMSMNVPRDIEMEIYDEMYRDAPEYNPEAEWEETWMDES